MKLLFFFLDGVSADVVQIRPAARGGSIFRGKSLFRRATPCRRTPFKARFRVYGRAGHRRMYAGTDSERGDTAGRAVHAPPHSSDNCRQGRMWLRVRLALRHCLRWRAARRRAVPRLFRRVLQVPGRQSGALIFFSSFIENKFHFLFLLSEQCLPGTHRHGIGTFRTGGVAWQEKKRPGPRWVCGR